MIKKIGLIISGILLIVLLESALCLTGKIFVFSRSFNLPLHSKKADKLIYCVGDSHTFGVGTSAMYSYPKQLQTLLNLNNPETTFKVVNLAIPGYSTKQQVERLTIFLDRNKADLIILLTGGNNYFEIKAWKNKSFLMKIIIRIQKTRIYKIMRYVLIRFFKLKNVENVNAPMDRAKYEEYMEYCLNRAKSLCKKHDCRLLLLSYYRHHDEYIERLAKQSGILYFNLHRDFSEIITQEDIKSFISRDGSHLNHYGYKIYAELLYEKMFLHRRVLNLRLNPLKKKIDKDSFYLNPITYFLRYAQGKSVFY